MRVLAMCACSDRYGGLCCRIFGGKWRRAGVDPSREPHHASGASRKFFVSSTPRDEARCAVIRKAKLCRLTSVVIAECPGSEEACESIPASCDGCGVAVLAALVGSNDPDENVTTNCALVLHHVAAIGERFVPISCWSQNLAWNAICFACDHITRTAAFAWTLEVFCEALA